VKRKTEGEAYGAFAYAYDKALGQRFFAAASRVLDEVLAGYPTDKRTHLDIACGTGLVSAFFHERGWKSLGVDASTAMLQVAHGRTPHVVAADMRALPIRSTFARITCLFDSLNHLLDAADLAAAFQAARSVMAEDSLFVFDMNHPEIYPEVWGIADPYVAEGPDYHLEIATSYRVREKLGRAMVRGWAMTGGERAQIREQHLQRAYDEDEIRLLLAQSGLEPLEVRHFDPYNESDVIDAPTVKLLFVCRPAASARTF
jgi:SAM-dependent methyltransferase